MKNTNMSFGSYVWSENPSKLTVTYKNDISERSLPYMDTAVELLGRKKRVVKGTGSFFGEDFQKDFNELEEIFMENTPRLLAVPGLQPIMAMFTSLQYIGINSENILEYSFEFTEWDYHRSMGEKKVIRAIDGESLWNYAGESSVEELVKRNPHIPYINTLTEGEIIYL